MTNEGPNMGTVREKFREIYGVDDPDNHPLFQEMERDFNRGQRSISSLLADIGEAARYRGL